MKPAKLIRNFGASVLGVAFCATAAAASAATAAKSPAAASPEAKVAVEKTAHEIAIHVMPPKNSHLNFEASWKLQVSAGLPLKDPGKTNFGTESLDKKLGGFRLPLAHKLSSSEKSSYTLTYFYCANDESWCKREQAKGVF
jgi:hypothetical protein